MPTENVVQWKACLTVYPQGIFSNGVTENEHGRLSTVHVTSYRRKRRSEPSRMSTTRQSPGSAPSTATGPERLWILVRSTFMMSSLPAPSQ